jgi:hypothetical protein
MNNLDFCESYDHNAVNKNLVSVCGMYCGACGICLATKENDTDKILQYAVVLNQSFEETFCDGCRAGRKSAHCSIICKFIDCTLKKGIEFCGECEEFPCLDLCNFQAKMPHRVEILESQIRIKEIGWQKWLIQMKEKYACPQCNTINTAYDIPCRNCGFVPSCKFVDLHKGQIYNHLDL